MNAKKLKDKICKAEMNIDDFSKLIGIDKSSFYRKLKNVEKFTIGEARKIKKELSLSDADATEIFLY